MDGPLVEKAVLNDKTSVYSKGGYNTYESTILKDGSIRSHVFVIIGNGKRSRFGLRIKRLMRRKKKFLNRRNNRYAWTFYTWTLYRAF